MMNIVQSIRTNEIYVLMACVFREYECVLNVFFVLLRLASYWMSWTQPLKSSTISITNESSEFFFGFSASVKISVVFAVFCCCFVCVNWKWQGFMCSIRLRHAAIWSLKLNGFFECMYVCIRCWRSSTFVVSLSFVYALSGCCFFFVLM